MAALEWGKRTGRARFTGISAHHRPWIAEGVARYPQIEVVITPYSAGSQQKPEGSMFDALRKHDVGFIGIKPFASGTLFQSRGVPDSATREEDNERARLALRHVLGCDILAASIPGLVTVDQVKNAAAAVKERRRLDLADARRHAELTAEMWDNLPADYHWLRDGQIGEPAGDVGPQLDAEAGGVGQLQVTVPDHQRILEEFFLERIVGLVQLQHQAIGDGGNQGGVGHGGEAAVPVVRAAVLAPQMRDAGDVPGFGEAGDIGVRLHDVVGVPVDPLLEIETIAARLAARDQDLLQRATDAQVAFQRVRLVGGNRFLEP
jgi:hypothetical protein